MMTMASPSRCSMETILEMCKFVTGAAVLIEIFVLPVVSDAASTEQGMLTVGESRTARAKVC